jgi:glycosyltransferase involved in cell wall biosynthesis
LLRCDPSEGIPTEGLAVLMHVAVNGWFLNSPATGTGQYLRRLVTALVPLARELGLDLAVIAPRTDSTVNAPVCLAPPGLAGNLGKVQFEHVTFPRAAGRKRYSIAHVPYFGPPLFPSIPTVVTVHDLIPLLLPEYRGSFAVRIYTRLAAAGARRARAVIADSEASRRDILAHLQIPAERVSVIYLAADPSFRPVEEQNELARVREKYHLPELFALYLGGFDVRKNLRVLIEAFAALERERAAGWKLVIAGRLPEADTPFFPDPRVGANSRVQFVGPVAEEDKPALYSSARVFVFPSRYEGFGLPPLEAMACGTPVLCANTSSLPEVVGDAGILLKPSDIPDWVQALSAVMSDDARWRALHARGLAQSTRFSWERTARETARVYRSLAGQVANLAHQSPFDK